MGHQKKKQMLSHAVSIFLGGGGHLFFGFFTGFCICHKSKPYNIIITLLFTETNACGFAIGVFDSITCLYLYFKYIQHLFYQHLSKHLHMSLYNNQL